MVRITSPPVVQCAKPLSKEGNLPNNLSSITGGPWLVQDGVQIAVSVQDNYFCVMEVIKIG